MKRAEIKDVYKWDLSTIYRTDEEWEKEFENVSKEVTKLGEFTDLMSSSKRLLEFMKLDEKTGRNIEKLYVYAHMSNDAEMSDSKYQAMYGKSKDLCSLYSSTISYVNPTMLKYDYSKIEEYYKEEPELEKYQKIFKEIFRYKPHTLSDKEEKILSSLSTVFSNVEDNYSYLTDSDMKFGTIKDEEGKEVILTESNYSNYLHSKNREVRKNAFEKIMTKYGEFENSISSMMSGQVDMLTTLAKIRGYNSSLEASLFDEEIDPVVYSTLIDTVSEHLDVLFRYFEEKRKMLNLDELHLYDTYVNVASGTDKEYSFDEAHELVIKATSILGEEYTKNLEKAFTERWIDIYPNDSKRGGAYSGGTYDTKPFVLLNYEGKYNDVSTVAHELGHSMHSYLTRTNNPYQTGEYKIFVAEVASTVNELLLAKYMLKNSNDPKEKLSILSDLMGLYKSTIYRQVMFAEFEKIMHEQKESGEVLTADLLKDIYYKLNLKYFGDKVVVDDVIKNEWMRIPHFYYNFYVYKYAIGLSCASKIVTDLYNNVPGARERYINFLSSGSRKSPMELLKDTGCDLTTPEVVESAIKMFDELLDEFVETYKKVGEIDE